MIKKSLKKNMINFLQIPNKLSSKKKKQINKSKQNASIKETSSRKATISNLKSSDQKELPVPILVTKILKFKPKDIDIAMIDVDVYHIVYYLKKA